MKENDLGIFMHCTNYYGCEYVTGALTNSKFTRLVVEKYQ